MNLTIAICLLSGAAVGAVVAWLALKQRVTRLETILEQERKATTEKITLLEESERRLTDTFKALSGDALKSNNVAFIQLATATLEKYQQSARSDLEQKRKDVEQFVKPIADSLEKVNTQIVEIEKVRRQDYGGLTEHLQNLRLETAALNTETRNLGNALRKPMVRGRWGEIQLERVVELAGMKDHCDFRRQTVTETDDGRLRPDLVVHLPGGKTIVVDAKAPIEAYLAAHEAQDETVAKALMKDHARLVKTHVAKLSEKSYWSQFVATPEFVVMFLPGENFFSGALEQEPSLIEDGVKQHVIIATPTTLIAMLQSVAYGWRQEKIAESAHEISELGRSLYDRLRVLAEHFGGVGNGLERAVKAYNDAAGSLESRVLVTARRFQELDVAAVEDIPELPPLEKFPRSLQAPEFSDPPAGAPRAAAQASMFDTPPSAPGNPARAARHDTGELPVAKPAVDGAAGTR
jgi:DNA recombination protein RmuC